MCDVALKALAEDYKNYLKYMPDAHLILSGHADPPAARPNTIRN
jgi:hypothetical protein